MSGEQLCLGRISSIENYQLNVSLLHGAKGRVKITDVSSQYRTALEKLVSGETNDNVRMLNQMFYPGQIVRCSVKGDVNVAAPSPSRNVIDLSLDPRTVNRNLMMSQVKPYVAIVGSVSSIEDNGYIIDSGIRALNVFLPFNKTSLPESERFSLGSLVEFVVQEAPLSGKSSRFVQATMQNEQVIVTDPLPFDCLLPGMCVSLKVVSASHEGLQCVFQSYNVLVPPHHCPLKSDHYSKKSRVTACIILVDLATKDVIASLLPHFLSHGHDDAFKRVKIGTKCTDAVINRRERRFIYLRLPSLDIRGILLKANAFDGSPPKNWTAHIPADAPIKCRVIDFDFFLNMPIVSCKQQVFESKFLSLDDVKVGTTVSVTVKKFTKRGVGVRLPGKIRGVIPFLHLSDVVVSDPQSRFEIGSKLDAYVLAVEPEKQQVVLTAKKSLIHSTVPILGSSNMLRAWDSLQQRTGEKDEKNLVVSAVVVYVSERGVLVSGVNNIRGWIPRRETYADDSQVINELFTKGETIQLRVLKRLTQTPRRSTKPSSEFLLSQILDPQTTPREAPTKPTSVSLGDVYYCLVNRFSADGLKVGLYKTDKGNIIAEGFLPFSQLSDSLGTARIARQARAECFLPKTTFSTNINGTPTRVVVVDINASGIIVSAKSSLVSAAEERQATSCGFLQNFDQLTVGSQWLGWVAHHKDYGIFVQFPGGFRGLAPIRYLTDRRAPDSTDWSALFPPGATVEAKVVEVKEPERQRFLISLRMTDTYTCAAAQYVKSAVARAHEYLDECRWLCSRVSHLNQLSSFFIGDLVQMKVDGLTEELVTGTVNGVPAAVLLPNTAEVECAVGRTYPAVVTLVNLDASLLEVSLLPWLLRGIKQRTEGEFASNAMKVRVGQTVSSTVVSIGNARDVVVVALKQHALGHLAVLPARRSFNDVLGGNAWALSQVNRVTVRRELSTNKTITSFLCTLSIYDPLTNSKQSVGAPMTPEVECQQLTIGTRLPQVIFIGLKGRTAFFRLPETRNSRDPNLRVFCRLVDLVRTAKEARKFVKSPPELGTVFEDALVIGESTPASKRKGPRLPLSRRCCEISFLGKKELEVGDLVCGQFLGSSGLCWKLLLPTNARGLLHVSCMSKSSTTDAAGSPQFPRHPKHGTWLTCRLVDEVHSAPPAVEQPSDDQEMEVDVSADEAVEPLIAAGDEIIPVGDHEDMSPAPFSKAFYVSTDGADMRQWNPEKYKPIELELNATRTGFVKRCSKDLLVVSIAYNVDVDVPKSSSSFKRRFRTGSTVEIIITSLEPLRGRLVSEPEDAVKPTAAAIAASASSRRRTASMSQTEAALRLPAKRRRRGSVSCGLAEDEAASVMSRFEKYLPPQSPSPSLSDDDDDQDECTVSGAPGEESTSGVRERAIDQGVTSLLTSMESESRLAAIAQATTDGDSTQKLPRLSSVEEFEVAVRNSPGNARLWTLYAAHHLSAGNVAKARSVLQRAMETGERAVLSTAGPAEAANFTGSLLQAALNLEIAVDDGGCEGGKDKLAELEAVISRIDQLDKETFTKKAVDTLSTAGLHSQAEGLAKKLVKRHSLNPDAWLVLVRARLRAGNVVAAREAQRNAGRILRLAQIPHFALGSARLEFEFGDVDRAINLVEEQLAASPRRKSIYVSYLKLLLSAGRTSDAESVRARALKNLSEKDQEAINKLF
uniref:S1 motif domain-containing protein n=3 Tax=Mesocestoides corti TaxID=53468 RepID=A0A5K3EL14_MESCO